MNVAIIVATFGSEEWRERGKAAYQDVLEQGAYHTLRWHEPDSTLAGVRNAAAAAANGDWLCFVDADDSLCPGYLEAMEDEVSERLYRAGLDPPTDDKPLDPERTLLVPAVEYPDSRRPEIPAWGRPLIEINCAVIGTLVPRRLFLKVGGFRDRLADGSPLPAPGVEDWDLWLRCQIAGAVLVPVPDAVYCASSRAGAGSHDRGIYDAVRAELEPAWRKATG